MPELDSRSLALLSACDPQLQMWAKEVVKKWPCRVECGFRSKQEQDKAHAAGTSTVQWPNSKHNSLPSKAVDLIPLPVEWPDLKRMAPEVYARALGRWYMFVGYGRAVADRLGLRLRFGADWDGDLEVKDQNFHDLPHVELID